MIIETSGQTTLLDVHPGAYGDVVAIAPPIEEMGVPCSPRVGLTDRWRGMSRLMTLFGAMRQRDGILAASMLPNHRARLEEDYGSIVLTNDVLPGAERNRENIESEARSIFFRVTGYYALKGEEADIPEPATVAYQDWLRFRNQYTVGEDAPKRRASTKKHAERNLKIYGVKPGF